MLRRPFAGLWTLPLLALIAGCATAPRSELKARTILLSLDGLDPAFYRDPALESPVLKRLAAEGASADSVEVIYPSVTYPVHTTLVTGVPSGRHGITSNRVFNWESGPSSDWYWEANKIKVPTLWELATEKDRKVALLGWPVTVGARAEWAVPEVFPPNSFDLVQVWNLTASVTRPDLLKELPPGPFKGTLDRDQWMSRAAEILLKKHSPDLTLLHFSHVDVVQHLQGPKTPAFHKALAEQDQLLGELVSKLDLSRDCLMIVGDHGFASVKTKLRINTLFVQKGWLDGVPSKNQNWKVVAATSGAQAAIYLKDRSIEKQVFKLLKQNAKGKYRVLDRKELDRLEAFPEAFVALEPEAGYAITQDTKGPLQEAPRHAQGEHGYLPSKPEMATGFIATGACATPGKRLGKLDIYDVAATVASQVGVKLASDRGKPLNLR